MTDRLLLYHQKYCTPFLSARSCLLFELLFVVEVHIRFPLIVSGLELVEDWFVVVTQKLV